MDRKKTNEKGKYTNEKITVDTHF